MHFAAPVLILLAALVIIACVVSKDVRAVESALERRVPARYLEHAHHWLILHGRYVCQARKPQCAVCSVRAWCDHAHLQSPRE